MSLEHGMSAINLQMSSKVPRTEYSADNHWELVKRVTGLEVDHTSSVEQQARAAAAFREAWDYDFSWNILIHSGYLGKYRTQMGHAVYAAGGVDYDNEVINAFHNVEDVLSFDPLSAIGKIDQNKMVKAFNEHYHQSCLVTPNAVNMTGIYITMISGLLELFGWDMLLESLGTDAKGFGEVANRYASWICQYFEALANSDAPIVMVHDDIVWTSGAFIHPNWYREYIFPNYKRLFAPLIESGKKIMYTSDGNFTQFIDDIADCGVHGFVMEPITDMRYIADKYGNTHVFIGNADTNVLLRGTKDSIEAEVKRCMDIGKKYPGFFLAVGNHIPANTPVDNALYYQESYLRHCRR